ESADFYISLKNTAIYALVSVPVGLALSLLLAIMLNQPIKGRDLFRLLYYIPAVLPVAGAARAWRLFFGMQSGLVNAFLSVFRPGTAIDWIRNQFFTVLYLYDWWHVGGGMVLFLAALQGIPVELYEAARLDGANRLRLFRHITLPLITPVVFFQLIMGLLGALQILDVPILIYGTTGLSGQVNMPRGKFMYMIYIYSQVFDFQRFGYGVALSWIFFIIVLVLTLLILATSRYWVYYEVAQEGEAR
ncbi:MAG: sugar ABC transporter permease, partial [Chloroflexota bacterium]|nr:sugar ABC transporter permease [Chloroflexota bacterium]